jgi:segregation and condensation protein B
MRRAAKEVGMDDRSAERAILEALIFASEQPAKLPGLRRAVSDLTAAGLREHVDAINAELAASGRPYEIAEVAGGYQFRTRPALAEALREAQPERRLRLSRAALECLAVVAYRQPITRAEIDDVRGVDSGASLRTLLERDLLRVVGRRDAPGRPVLYGTSTHFLELFSLSSLRDLPELRAAELAATEEGTPLAGEPLERGGEGSPEPVELADA